MCTAPGRALALAAALLSVASAGCQQPRVGERHGASVASEGPRIVVEEAWLDLHGHVVATFRVTQEQIPLLPAEVNALAPRFTLARLTDHPAADGQRGWESLVLTGPRVTPALAPGGPDDPDVLTSVRQPGAETPAALVDLGGGRFRYVFASAVPALDPDETVRVGVWLSGAEAPSLRTSSTLDFRPSGGVVEGRDTVLDQGCAGCHGQAVVAHETRVGVRLCLTCHTWQNADPLTVDPAAMAGATARTNPNPLELGRLVHRIHRGKDLPTLYQTAWDGISLTSTTVPFATAFAPPFVQQKPGSPVRAILPGRKYSVVGEDGGERIFAAALTIYPADPSTGGSMTLAAGGLFPRDLRDCAVCHADAPQAYVVKFGISRRTCSGCHPEVWFRDTSPAADRSRYPHPGGPQSDDTQCLGCHVNGTPKLYAPLDEVHVPPARAPRYNQPVVEIVRVDDLVPGRRPKVTFRLSDRLGPIVPTPGNPAPAFEPAGAATSSYAARKFGAGAIAIKVIGPAERDYAGPTAVQLNSGSGAGNPDPVALSTTGDTDEYVYTFASTLPAASGTFLVGIEARRTYAPAGATPYDKQSDVFLWPYTGETVNETPENTYVYVSSASGTWTKAAGSPGAVPRRTIVSMQKCERCHDRIEFHSGQRHDPAWCVVCHGPDASDLPQRVNVAQRQYAGGPVNVGATYDGIEERSSHLKRNVHRIHTGAREGAATLEAIRPFALYFSKAYFFDRGGFPGDLRNCTLCHEGKSYLVDAIPADAPPSRGNESASIWHWTGTAARPGESGGMGLVHDPREPAVLPIAAACTACHETGPTLAHVASKTVDGVETCARCHVKGALAVEVVHGLAPLTGGGATASFSSIVQEILVPRCATSACHAAGAVPPRLDATGAYQALVGVQSGQSSLKYVDPNAPEQSYLVHKLRGTASSVGGSVATVMPPDGALAPADLAAVEAWISNGAPND